ncbi:CRTAC1 family protein [Roseibium album]|uniref:CRTAC1 family protein n=1 Tax=Roseibium album TaxID=311410 RepID=UPI003BB16C26
MRATLKQNAGKIAAAAVVTALLMAATVPPLIASGQDVDASRFQFSVTELIAADQDGYRSIRDVHPELMPIVGWVSSVGASVAMGDLDGDGIHNDLCLVETRNDTVTLLPAPGPSSSRYAPILLPTPSLEYKPNTIAPMGCLFADANADGQEDIVVYYWGRTPVIFENTGALQAQKFLQRDLLPHHEIWFTNAMLFTDLNGDGYGDFVVGNYYPDNGGVLDVDGFRPVEMQHSMSRAANAGRNRIFLNEGGPRADFEFEDQSSSFDDDMALGWTLAMGAADLNNDLLPELYVANDFGPDRLLVNESTQDEIRFSVAEGRRGFTDIRSGVLGRDSFKGMGVDFGDVNRDGLLDIYVSNIAEEYALQESHFLFIQTAGEQAWTNGSAPFQNASGRLGLARSSWSWDAKLADFDNDGRLEAVQATGFVKGSVDRWPELQELATGNDELLKFSKYWPRFGVGDDLSGHRNDAFFVADVAGRYRDIASEIGLADAGVSRGIALADIDADGDLDFAVARQWEPSKLFVNQNRMERKSLILDLRLTNPGGSTRAAIGALARVSLPDGTSIVGFSDVSNGHSGRRSSEIHFGLGEIAEDTLIEILVKWRDSDGVQTKNFKKAAGRHRLVLDRQHLAGTHSNFEEGVATP